MRISSKFSARAQKGNREDAAIDRTCARPAPARVLLVGAGPAGPLDVIEGVLEKNSMREFAHA
jgi:hypothetical protein